MGNLVSSKGSATNEEATSSAICPACFDLDYTRYSAFPDHVFLPGASLRARYKLTTSDDLQAAAVRGCPICDRLLQRAIDFFWNSDLALDEPGIQRRRTWTTVTRPFTRVLCIALQPGSSLLLFRVILYDDMPDRTFVHALTVRDSVSRIEFYREPSLVDTQHAVYPAVGSADHVPASISLERAAELAARWMKQCDDAHPKCAPGPSHLPKRLLDVQDGVRLIDTLVEEGIPLDAPYMTLSHCWGSHRFAEYLLKTTQDTLHDRRQQVPWYELPRLFQEAIQLVRALGCRYIWIDSLCIIQDDQEDWMVESATMSDTYYNATLNIAATAMRNSSVGLFHPRRHGQGFRELRRSVKGTTVETSLETIEMAAGETPIFARASHDRSHEVLYGDMEYFRTPMEPLLNRAWVFQERLLSRRTLHFGASELLFECRTDCFCECSRIGHAHALSSRNVNAGPTGLGQDSHGPGDGIQSTRYVRPKKVLFYDVCEGSVSALDFWLRAVEEYSFLLLTRERDRPFALAGIAKRIQCACPDDSDGHSGLINSPYLAGLWAQDLPRALIWAPYRKKSVIRSPTTPSWSWMSRHCFPYEGASICAVRYKHVTQHHFVVHPSLKIHEQGTFCEYEHDNPFSTPIAGQIHLSALCCSGVVEIVPSKRGDRTWNGRNELRIVVDTAGGDRVTVPFAADCPGYDRKTVCLGDRVLCVLFGKREAEEGVNTPHYFLVLAPVDGQDGLHRRMGLSETADQVPPLEDVERLLKII